MEFIYEKKILFFGFAMIAGLFIWEMGCMDNSASNSYGNNPVSPPANTFVMSGLNFIPNSMTVRKGTTVTWKNSDGTVHTSTSDTAGLWDTGNITPGSSKTTMFNTAGTFTFHCTYHRAMGMTGTITVQ